MKVHTYLSSLKTKSLCLVFFSLHALLVNRCVKWPGLLSITSLISTSDTKSCGRDFDLNTLYFLHTQVWVHTVILSGPIINNIWTNSTIPIQMIIIFFAAMDVSTIQSTSWNS